MELKLGGLKGKIFKKVEGTEEDDDFEEKRRLDMLLKSFNKTLPVETILIAIQMYEEGKSYIEIENFLKMEQERIKTLGKVDYYGGKTLKEAREEEMDR